MAAQDGRTDSNRDLATVDYGEFTTAWATCRQAATEHERAAADEHLIATCTGEFATGLGAPWAEPVHAHHGFR